MRLELTGRHVTVTPSLRSLVNQKLARVLRQVNNSGISASVIVTTEKFQKVVEVALHARGERFLHAVARAEAWDLAVNQAVEKLEQQARKMKGKWQSRRRVPGRRARGPAPPGGEEPARRPRVVRASRYSVRPMTVDEALLELEGQEAAFLVFRDATTDAVNVLYRRKDGQFGLIEPDA